jgi:predicted nucleic acid-binding protein
MDFVDTSAWFAYFVPTDPDHQRVRAGFRSVHGPLVSTDYCVDETLTLLAARGEIHRAMEAGHAFFYENIVQLHFVTPDEVRRAWILFQQRATAGWSFTDCTSKVVIDHLQIKNAVALDDHFRQFGVLVIP